MMESNLLYQYLDTYLRPYKSLFNIETKFSLPISTKLLVEAYKFFLRVFHEERKFLHLTTLNED